MQKPLINYSLALIFLNIKKVVIMQHQFYDSIRNYTLIKSSDAAGTGTQPILNIHNISFK